MNELINKLYPIFGNFLSIHDISETTNDGMVKYETYSIPSLNSTTNTNNTKSIWLPTSIIIGDAHRIMSTILYSTAMDKIPVDFADYVIIYENIMIPLENYDKELYEEILKISFRLNRVALPPFRLLIIHKSQLLLLERKESKPILKEKESISILQLIMYHLVPKGSNQIENENFDYAEIFRRDFRNKYWPINEVKMGIIPWKLIHPLEHSRLRRIIAGIIGLSESDIIMNINVCFQLLEKIFCLANADISYIRLRILFLSKLVHVYDYPLLIALPYDRLMLSQFSRIQCSDGRYAQGIMANGKYYSMANHRYTPMSELKINRGSIIHLRFNEQHDTIDNGKVSSRSNTIKINESYDEISGRHRSVYYDNNTVQLMFPSQVLDSIRSSTNTTTPDDTRIDYLRVYFKVSNNWLDSSMQISKLIVFDINPPSVETTHHGETYGDNYSDLMLNDDFSLVTLTDHASTSSISLADKPECLNCLSPLNDDHLGCPRCTQVFCRICIEYNYADDTRDQCCPACFFPVEIADYRKSTIIGKFEREGVSALACLKCRSIPRSHRLCCDPKCSALFCYDCCKQATEPQPSTTIQEHNSTGTMKCLQCKTTDTYVSGAVTYYTVRIAAYRTAQEVESYSETSLSNVSLPNTVWKEEDCLPELGTFEENYNRIIPVIRFDGEHIQFGNENRNCPLLIINEPFEYMCPESLQLSYWNTENEKNRWENDKNVRFFKYNHSSIAAYIPHFSTLAARNSRFREHFTLDKRDLAIEYDYDFTAINDAGTTFTRGSERYTRPCKWYRKALRVPNKFENDKWFGTGKDAWPVAYHGTDAANIKSIVRNGLRAGGSNGVPVVNGSAHGRGICLSPNPLKASLEKYSRIFDVDGSRHQVMFQVRVRPSAIKRTMDPFVWICDNPQDVRAYGILIREL